MGFFAQFFTWLNGQLLTYVGSKAATVAAAVEPAAVTLATIYVMLWGWMSLQGMIQEPVLQGIKRILVMALILGVGIRLWTYNSVITDTFYNAGPAGSRDRWSAHHSGHDRSGLDRWQLGCRGT